jgi:hypothetical protein
MNNKLDALLLLWKLNHCIPNDAKDLLRKIFKPEIHRITIQQILSHPYVMKCNALKYNTEHIRLSHEKAKSMHYNSQNYPASCSLQTQSVICNQ